MTLELKLRKIGNSLGVVLPKEALARLNSGDGDTLVFSESPDGGFRVTPNRGDFAHQMAVAEGIAQRYRNALRELAK
ncbi:MAG TPA: AbrB/MazE/SpoVT family DNA-binding domain-containing protein [Methylomirabilota bacterium]|nr:AbrB/MazE/SpoVT family DNA-binding domain-containing protein [Methylomirabilota bacterium]